MDYVDEDDGKAIMERAGVGPNDKILAILNGPVYPKTDNVNEDRTLLPKAAIEELISSKAKLPMEEEHENGKEKFGIFHNFHLHPTNGKLYATAYLYNTPLGRKVYRQIEIGRSGEDKNKGYKGFSVGHIMRYYPNKIEYLPKEISLVNEPLHPDCEIDIFASKKFMENTQINSSTPAQSNTQFDVSQTFQLIKNLENRTNQLEQSKQNSGMIDITELSKLISSQLAEQSQNNKRPAESQSEIPRKTEVYQKNVDKEVEIVEPAAKKAKKTVNYEDFEFLMNQNKELTEQVSHLRKKMDTVEDTNKILEQSKFVADKVRNEEVEMPEAEQNEWSQKLAQDRQIWEPIFESAITASKTRREHNALADRYAKAEEKLQQLEKERDSYRNEIESMKKNKSRIYSDHNQNEKSYSQTEQQQQSQQQTKSTQDQVDMSQLSAGQRYGVEILQRNKGKFQNHDPFVQNYNLYGRYSDDVKAAIKQVREVPRFY